MFYPSFPARILIIVFFWIAEAARPAVDTDESRNHPAAGGFRGHSHHVEADAEHLDEAAEGALDDGDQLDSDSATVSVSKNDSSTNTGFFQDLIQGHEQIKSAMVGYEDVVAKGEKRALAAYDKLGEFQNTIKNLTDPLRSLPIQVHKLRQNMVRNFEAQTRELENELRGATAELTKEDSTVEEEGDENAEDTTEATSMQRQDAAIQDSTDNPEEASETTTPQEDASNDEVDSSDGGSGGTDTSDGSAPSDSQAEDVGNNNTSD